MRKPPQRCLRRLPHRISVLAAISHRQSHPPQHHLQGLLERFASSTLAPKP